MQNLWLLIFVSTLLACNSSYQYIPPPATFQESDLVGTWQAKYGTTRIDTIIIRTDGTYQQKFQSANLNYSYESPWNEWHVERSSSGKFTLHLEGMRYYASTFELGETGGRNPRGEPALFYDPDEDKVIEMTDKVILRIRGDDNFSKKFPRGIILWHMRTDPDDGSGFFTLIDD